MRLIRLGANDDRFRTVNFRPGDGLHLLIAEKTGPAGLGDTRNGVGKSATVNIIRFLLGGSKPSDMAKVKELAHFEFYAILELPGSEVDPERVTVRRALNSTKVSVEGWSRAPAEPMAAKDWVALLGEHLFRKPEELKRPTNGQLVAQFARTSFAPTKTHPSETDWESGSRYAFLFGLDAELAAGAGEVARLDKQQKTLTEAARDGAISDLRLDVPSLRARLVTARRERDSSAEALSNFRVEDRYADHQDRANSLSAEIRDLNERELILKRRTSDLDRAMRQEVDAQDSAGLLRAAETVYGEVGLAFSAVALRRFDAVSEFHTSVVRNRRLFLENELQTTAEQIRQTQERRRALDVERASVMELLQSAVALSTYREAQASLSVLDAEIAGIDDRLRMAESFENIGEARELKAVENKRRMRLQLKEWEPELDEARALFSELAAEIYGHGSGKTKRAHLDLGVSPRQGGFLVKPELSADASAGISSVKTFIMDMVVMYMAGRSGHSPGFLIHDSALFDPVDSEQIASCLNIGARLAEEEGFQYLVTMNSDTLGAAIADSDGGFDEGPYIMELRLSDKSVEQRLFGFQFG